MVSEETGGKFEPEVEEIFADYGDRVTVPTPLWPFLAGLALVLYLLDVDPPPRPRAVEAVSF